MKYLQAGFKISGNGPVKTRLVTKLTQPESLTLKPTQKDGQSNTVGQLPTETLRSTAHLLTDTRPYSSIVTNLTPQTTFNYNNAKSQPPQLQTISASHPAQTTREPAMSLVVSATQSSVSSGNNQTQSSGAHNSRLIIGTIVGGVLGLFTCIVVVYCALNYSGKARKKRHQLELAYGNTQRESNISLPRPWSELDHLYDRELDETIPHAQAPAEFNPSPFQAEKLLNINPMHAPRDETGRRIYSNPAQQAKLSQESKADYIKGKPMEFYQIRARPDIQPARKAPPPPPSRTQLEVSHTTRDSAHILSDQNSEVAEKATKNILLSKVFDKFSRSRDSRLSVVSSVYSTYEPEQLPETDDIKPQARTRMASEKDTMQYNENALYDDGFGEYPAYPDFDEIPTVKVSRALPPVNVKNIAHPAVPDRTYWPNNTSSERNQRQQAGQLPKKYKRSSKGTTSNHTNAPDHSSVLPEEPLGFSMNSNLTDEDFVFEDYVSIMNRLER